MDTLTVLICTYNNAKMLDQTLASLAAQVQTDAIDWSVLVIDNNCTDQTAQVVDRHLERGKIPRLARVVETRQGLTSARQRGVRESAGSNYLAFVDDDVLLAQDWIVQAHGFLRDHPDAGVACGKIILQWPPDPPALALDCRVGFAHYDKGEQPIRFSQAGMAHMVGAAMLLRRKAVLDSGWMDRAYLSDRRGKALSSGGDMELALRIARAGYERWYTPALICRHVIPPSRTSLRYLCRLFYGMALCGSQLAAIGLPTPPTLTWKIKRLMKDTSYLLRRALALVVWDWCRGRRGGKRLVQVCEAAGRIRSAWRLLLTPGTAYHIAAKASPGRRTGITTL